MSEILDIVSTLDQEYLPKEKNNPEIISQLLSDLGYLVEFEGETSLSTEIEVERALRQFKQELEQSSLISKHDVKQIKQIYGDQAEEKLLKFCLDLDEGPQFKQLPRFGERGLEVRVLHYRLKMMGFYQNPIETYFNAMSYSGLAKLADYVGKTLFTTLNLLGDLQEFTVKYLQHKGYQQPVALFKIDPEILSSLDPKLPDYSGAFKRTVKQELRNYDDVFEELKKNLFKRNDNKVDLDDARDLSQNPDNSFVIRLIQIHQWMAGFYVGKLDGELGKVTLESLRQVIESYNASGEDIDEKKTLVVLVEDEGIIAFNTIYFLNKYKIERSQSDKTLETLEILNNNYLKADIDQQHNFESHFNNGVRTILDGTGSGKNNKQGFIGRIFHGTKAFFKKVFRLAGKIFSWIAKAVEKMTSFISYFIRKIYEVIKQAAIHFVEGVKFLLGKTQIVTSTEGKDIFTQFDTDKDVINYAYRLDQELLIMHNRIVNEKVQALRFSLLLIALVFKSLKMLLAGAFVAWPLFLFSLAKSFKQLTDQYKLIQTI